MPRINKMSDIIIISLLLLISWTFGRCALLFLQAEDNLNDLSIAIGLSLTIIALNLLYFIGDFRISSIRTGLLVCFIFSAFYIAAYIWRVRSFHASDLISAVTMYALLIIPAIIGGEQYYVFRGNWWDHFMYLTSAYGFANYPLSSIINFDTSTFLSNDLLIYANQQHSLRPSVILIFSLFLSKGHGDIFLRGFLYNSALLAAVYPPLRSIFQVIRNNIPSGATRPWLLSLLPAGYILGFWGQYIFDINAWGQLASLPLILAFVASFLILLDKWHSSGLVANHPPVRHYSVAIILFSGSWFIYPENALIHLCMLALATASWLFVIRPPAKFRTSVWLMALPLFSILFALPNYQTTITFLIPQAIDGLTKVKDWWLYFDSYLVGIDTPFDSFINSLMLTVDNVSSLQNLFSEFWYLPFYFITSFFGYYFITPQNESGFLFYPWQAIVIIFSIALSTTFFRSLFMKFRAADTPVVFIRGICIAGLIMTAYLAIKHQWWSAGKALSFTSPYLYILLLLPLLSFSSTLDRGPMKHIAVAVANIVLVLSLGFGAARVYASMDENGIGYYRNYPSIQGKENKMDILWKLDIEEARGCTGVNLGPFSQPFFQHYAKLKLAYAGIPYFTRQPVLTYLVVGDPIGTMPDIPTDCIITPYFDDKDRLTVSVRRMPRQ